MNEDIFKQYSNKAYPKDIAKIMKFINESSFLSEISLKFLNDSLRQTTTDKNKLLAGLPINTVIYHKTGSSSRTIEG